MCGIYGCCQRAKAAKSAIGGLEKLEYRGYDSAGIAFLEGEKIEIIKSVGKVSNLKEKVGERVSNLAIAHTRWATHGKATTLNCHPHTSKNFIIVHNGIIENFKELKSLASKDFYSETDSEVIAKVLEKNFENLTEIKDVNERILNSISKTQNQLVGSWAVILICRKNPSKIYAFKNKSPLIVAKGKGENFVASDINAFEKKEKNLLKYYNLNNGNIAEISRENVYFYDEKLNKIGIKEIKKQCEIYRENCNFKHKMLKEINEIPEAIYSTKKYIKKSDFKKLSKKLKNYSKITIVGCGTAYHAGLYGKFILEKYLNKNVSVELAGEFRYKTQIKEANELVLAISQSGETADTLAAIEIAKKNGAETAAITNVCSSSITRICDYVLLTHAGAEVAVAATKSYVCQILALYMLASSAAEKRIFRSLENVAHKAILNFSLENLKEFLDIKKFFFIGRLCDSATASEGALKLKEIAYVHSEGYPAGELKHGTLSLVDENSLVIAIITQSEILDKTLNAVHEVRARGAKVLIVSQFDLEGEGKEVLLPRAREEIMPLISVLPLQLFAYHYSDKNGLNPDMPRNLAKSVTVE